MAAIPKPTVRRRRTERGEAGITYKNGRLPLKVHRYTPKADASRRQHVRDQFGVVWPIITTGRTRSSASACCFGASLAVHGSST